MQRNENDVPTSSPLPPAWSTRPCHIISLSLPLPPLSPLHTSPAPVVVAVAHQSPARPDPPTPAGHHVFRLQRRRNRPLLRLPRRRRRPRLLLHGRGVRHGQERRGSGVDGGHAPGAGHEVHCARRHGGGARDLRTHHRRHHLHRDQPQGQALLPLRRLRAPLLRARLRARGVGCRDGHRHRRRRRGQGQCAAAKAVRGHDPHPHLCRSSRSLWPHRRHHPLLPCRPVPRRLEEIHVKRGAHGSTIAFYFKGLISS